MDINQQPILCSVSRHVTVSRYVTLLALIPDSESVPCHLKKITVGCFICKLLGLKYVIIGNNGNNR